MHEYDFSMQGLSFITLESEQDKEYVFHWTVGDFQEAIAELNKAGITEEQIQFLIGKVFSRFMDRQYQEVLLLALALRKGKITADKIHKKLLEMEFQARIHGKSIYFETESLPGMDAIKAYLGLGYVAD